MNAVMEARRFDSAGAERRGNSAGAERRGTNVPKSKFAGSNFEAESEQGESAKIRRRRKTDGKRRLGRLGLSFSFG